MVETEMIFASSFYFISMRIWFLLGLEYISHKFDLTAFYQVNLDVMLFASSSCFKVKVSLKMTYQHEIDLVLQCLLNLSINLSAIIETPCIIN